MKTADLCRFVSKMLPDGACLLRETLHVPHDQHNVQPGMLMRCLHGQQARKAAISRPGMSPFDQQPLLPGVAEETALESSSTASGSAMRQAGMALDLTDAVISQQSGARLASQNRGMFISPKPVFKRACSGRRPGQAAGRAQHRAAAPGPGLHQPHRH